MTAALAENSKVVRFSCSGYFDRIAPTISSTVPNDLAASAKSWILGTGAVENLLCVVIGGFGFFVTGNDNSGMETLDDTDAGDPLVRLSRSSECEHGSQVRVLPRSPTNHSRFAGFCNLHPFLLDQQFPPNHAADGTQPRAGPFFSLFPPALLRVERFRQRHHLQRRLHLVRRRRGFHSHRHRLARQQIKVIVCGFGWQIAKGYVHIPR